MQSSGDPMLASASANHRFVIPEENHWKVLRNQSSDLGSLISKNLLAIEKANSDPLLSPDGEGILDGIFGDANWGNKQLLPDHLLKNLIEEFSTVNLSLENIGEDALGNAYEYLLGKFAEDAGQNAQEFFTNRTLVTLMIKILDLKEGDSIYDPTCGTAGMLIMSKKYADSINVDFRTLSFYGQELYLLSSCISRMNMLVHDIEDFKIKWGDTLKNPAFTEGDSQLKTFDIVLANPPFSLDDWGIENWPHDRFGRCIFGTPSENCADYAWLQHMIYHLAPNGKIGMVLANGSLSSQSGGEGEIRKNIINADLVECIVAMPTQLFYTTQIPVSLWFLSKEKKQKGKTLFIDARKLGTLVTRKLRELTDEDIAKIADTYNAYIDGTLENEKGFCAVVTTEEIAKQDYILTPGRYVGIEEQQEDDEPFEEKMTRLTTELSGLFEKSHDLELNVREQLGKIGYKI